MDRKTESRISAARGLNVAIGLWLLVSAFVWAHGPEQLANAWVTGLLCTVFAVTAAYAPRVAYLNAALAVWLFISAFALPRTGLAMAYNHAICGVVLFFMSLATAEEPAKLRAS